MSETTKNQKPLGGKAYGSIPHLPGSRRGPADKGLSEHQARILTEKARDKKDYIIVQEKLDGSNVSVAKINGEIIAITRAGYRAETSPYKQHHAFKDWVQRELHRFDSLLQDGERCVGEWLMEAHGTRYNLPHEPFVIFDIMRGGRRELTQLVIDRCGDCDFVTPRIIHDGCPLSIEAMLARIDISGHGAIDPVEGAVWRVERAGEVDFLGKYVRPAKVDGKYLTDISGEPPIYNWTPE